jgi:hypothetical protein
MRKDMAKVLTESPRRGSRSQNLKTGFREANYDDREDKEDRYSLPKRGKMLMNSRDFGPHSEDKEFTDVLGPLKHWALAQVGRNWDTVYSEIRRMMPNTTKQTHHLIDTHLMEYFNTKVEVVKTPKGRRVYDLTHLYSFHDGPRELSKGDIYVDPDTHVLMLYRRGFDLAALRRRWREQEPKKDATITVNKSKLTFIEKRGACWVWCRYEDIPCGTRGTTRTLVEHHTLSKKELAHWKLQNENEV